MSVINRMLSQLDARRAATPDIGATGAAGAVEAIPVAAPRRLGLMVLGGAALVSAAAFGQWPALLGAPSAAPHPLVLSPAISTGSAVDAAPLVPSEPTPINPTTLANPLAVAAAPDAVPAMTATAPVVTAPAVAAPLARTTALPAPMAVAERVAVVAPRRAPAAPQTVAMAALPNLSIKDTPIRSLQPDVAPDTPAAAVTAIATAMTAPPVATQVAYAPPRDTGSVEKRLIPPSAAQRATLAYQQAIDQAASGHSNPAIVQALEALKADPDHIAARELAAVLMIESKRLGDAASLMREGLDRQPQQPHLIMLLARIEAETGATQAALDRLTAAPGLDGDGHGLRAALLARAQRYREAASAYEAAVRLQPDNASWWFGLGVSLDANGQAPLARQALERARAIGSLRGDALAYVEQKLSQ